MDIQYLNGIDIQYLDGTNIYNGPLDAQQASTLYNLGRIARRRAKARRAAVKTLTHGVTNQNAYKAEQLANGADLKGFEGNGSVEDEEKLRKYLLHTKEVADASPVMVGAYQNPKMLSQMIGHVLANWDTANREQAIDNIIAEEQRLQGLGAIADVDNARKELSQESFTDADVYMYGLGEAKNSFFSSLKKSLKPRLTTEAQDIVSSNPATVKLRNHLRHRTAQARKKHGKATTANTSASISGIDDDAQILLSGDDLQYAISGDDPMTAIARYLLRTRRVAEQHPEYFTSADEAKGTIASVDALMKVWDNETLRDKVFDQLDKANIGGELNGKLRKKLKKAVKKVTSAVKKVATAVKKVAKKVGKAVAKVAKKVWKLVVRFNPLTLLIRAGILGFCRLNMFKVANKCYIGSLSKADALKKGATAEEWEKSNKAYGHLKNAYTKLGGKESKLRSVLEKGNKKKWNGTEYPTDGNSIKNAAKAVSAADDKEAKADMDYDETLKEYQGKGFVSDNTVSTDTATVSKNEQITIIENERTAKNATKLYDGDDTTSTVLMQIPKAAKVYIDNSQTSGNFIAANYNGKNGWVLKSELAGLGNCDAESCAVLMAGAIYDMGTDGLGEPATATAVASASSVIASIMSKIKTIFGVVEKVVDKVKQAKDVVSSVKDKVQSVKAVKDTIDNVKAVKNTVNDVKSTVNDVKSGVQAVQNFTQSAKNIVPQSQNVAQSAVAKVQNIAQSAQSIVPQSAVSKVQNIAQSAQNIVAQGQNVAQSAVSKVQNIAQSAKNIVAQGQNVIQNAAATAQQPTEQTTSKGRTQATTSATNETQQQQATTQQPTQQNAPQSGLSTGAKIGIGLGALALVGLSIYAFRKK